MLLYRNYTRAPVVHSPLLPSSSSNESQIPIQPSRRFKTIVKPAAGTNSSRRTLFKSNNAKKLDWQSRFKQHCLDRIKASREFAISQRRTGLRLDSSNEEDEEEWIREIISNAWREFKEEKERQYSLSVDIYSSTEINAQIEIEEEIFREITRDSFSHNQTSSGSIDKMSEEEIEYALLYEDQYEDIDQSYLMEIEMITSKEAFNNPENQQQGYHFHQELRKMDTRPMKLQNMGWLLNCSCFNCFQHNFVIDHYVNARAVECPGCGFSLDQFSISRINQCSQMHSSGCRSEHNLSFDTSFGLNIWCNECDYFEAIL
ncbi:hypothetical protein G9A89_008646 [Geosiphon pyriformis]|nr:hypothetical protein G9A89_008646 [Geosiphon pyriformis]